MSLAPIGRALGPIGVGRRPPARSAPFTAASNQYLEATITDAALQPGSGDFWIGGWQRWTSVPAANMNLLRKYSSTSAAAIAYQVFKQTTNVYRLRIDNNAGGFQIVDASTFGAIVINVWYFIFAYYDKSGGNIGISINNGTANEAALTGTPLSDTQRFTVGAVYNGTTYDSNHDGRIDQLAIGKGTDLDLVAIRGALYNSGFGVRTSDFQAGVLAASGVSAFYEFDAVSGTCFDSIGSNHLTPTNCADVGRSGPRRLVPLFKCRPMITQEQIAQAVNDAGFEDAAAFSQFLAIASLVLKRDGMTAAIARARVDQQSASAATEATIQGYQTQYDALQAQIVALVTG